MKDTLIFQEPIPHSKESRGKNTTNIGIGLWTSDDTDLHLSATSGHLDEESLNYINSKTHSI